MVFIREMLFHVNGAWVEAPTPNKKSLPKEASEHQCERA